MINRLMQLFYSLQFHLLHIALSKRYLLRSLINLLAAYIDTKLFSTYPINKLYCSVTKAMHSSDVRCKTINNVTNLFQ